MTYAELKSIRELAIRYNRVNDEIERLRSFVTKATANLDGMPRSGQKHDAMAEYVSKAEKWLDEREELAGKILEEIISLSEEITTLPKKQADVVFGYYAEGKSIRWIAKEMHYSSRNCYKILKQGERKIVR